MTKIHKHIIATAATLLAILVIVGCEPPEAKAARQRRALESKVKTNMHTFQGAVENYAAEHNNVYPKNSDISWAERYLPSNFKNPITKAVGPGGAYDSGTAQSPGIVGFESDAEGRHYKITGYGVDGPIKNLVLTDGD